MAQEEIAERLRQIIDKDYPELLDIKTDLIDLLLDIDS